MKPGSITDHTVFLRSVGRDCESVASKFKDWNHLFAAEWSELKTMGLKPKMLKYIVGWRDWYRKGVDPCAISIPKRQKKYLKVKERRKREKEALLS